MYMRIMMIRKAGIAAMKKALRHPSEGTMYNESRMDTAVPAGQPAAIKPTIQPRFLADTDSINMVAPTAYSANALPVAKIRNRLNDSKFQDKPVKNVPIVISNKIH